MIPGFDRKLVSLTPPAAAVTGAVTVAYVDTQGASYLVVNVFLGVMAAATSVFKLTESDVSGSGYTDIVGSRFGTDNNDTGVVSVFPTTTDVNGMFSWFVDLRGTRKRYIKPAITTGGADIAAVIAELWFMANAPQTAAQSGYNQRMIGF
jgi:hypothetical protein